ncbi:MAG TPA: hypothetical protein VN408_38690 [Actinoplanes sp.]|nr:hypothetical protein [Actinoplanes sp.]
MFLWRYTERLADGDDGWWYAATRRTADMLEDGFWWVDDTGPVPMAALLIDTTAVLVHGLSRSHGAHPADVTGTDLVNWATPRIAGLLQLAEDLYLRPPADPDGMWAWHRAFGREWRTTVQQVAYLLVAAGHDLLPTASPDHPSAARPPATSESSTGRSPSTGPPSASRRLPDAGRRPRADPVAGLWRELIEGDDPGRRYPAVAGPAIVHGLTEMVRHFGYPAHR